ncbi:MAG: MFS transporter [Neisseriaceae bacterium]|nr:MAG: MFS transporter [Neisseriaceae bacterium]
MKHAITITLLSLVFLFQGTSDLYASSMPEMMKYFSTNQAGIQLTIIIFLVSYGIGQFIWVYYSERYSRKKVIVFNILVFIFASCMAMKSSTLEMLYIARLIQGISISGLNLNVKAMPLEIFDTTEIKIFFTYFALIWGAGGTIAPWIGSNIQYFFNWKYNFAALAIYAILTLLMAIRFIPIQSGKIIQNKISIGDYKTVLTNLGFISGVVAQSCTLSMFLAFNYYMSFYIQNIKHYSELTFGYLSFAAGLSFVLGCLLFRFSINKFNSNKLSIICSLVALAAATLSILLNNLASPSIVLTVIFTCLIIFCSGVMASENIGITMMFFPKKASVASCLHTAIHFIITSIFMYILSLFSYSSLLVISSFYLFFIMVFLATNQYCYIRLKKRVIA